ncbi:SAF domain-containing protein, partial [Klebsiella pneumoniae]|uniref:SAF domain-containing protein n=2 Tax=Bacteria TaxID=2 RepID=UPI003D3616D8
MVTKIREVESALGNGESRAVSTGELMNRANLAKSLVATRDIAVGEKLTRADVAIKSPGRGLQPN